jgi:hypothetical protein
MFRTTIPDHARKITPKLNKHEELAMNRNETIWPALVFFWAWWKLDALIGGYAFFGAIGLWFVGVIAIRMCSSTVHRLGFWGWVRLLELAGWYALAFTAMPYEGPTSILLMWGVATPLLFVGNVWRRAYDRFPPIQGAMRGMVKLAAVLACIAVPVVPWWLGPSFMAQLGLVAGAAVAAAIFLFYGWRLAAPPPSGQYDARLGTFETFQRRGMSHER